ncbi:alpha/beta fold hydrolase [Agromyces aerolatus]|uniref:alpha/beta fold hydrolase n=1 Tax=Agromyces sp. LY-1074 TaxID=3074080 RepID=UPI002854B0EC|nr:MULTISPECIES: alpha/beta hydrolase [unclassified Agromyces]MDR5700970.1 alpha/beta hydrolase [Agromyces sp. LY-1074]MDR5707369.1 alpha/beta hydrolase [Agromyces sp. LY-1358]
MHPTAIAALATVSAARAADRVSPRAAARLALPLFMSSRPRRPVRPHERAVHEQARRSIIRVRGRDVAVSEWGRGGETILLAHGWRGRAAQFAPLVRELRAEGFGLVAFDAPANGDSGGRRTDIRDWLATIEALQSRHGRFHTIVGHSFGSLAALSAVREGVAAGGVVAIAGMSSARYLVDAFGDRVGLGAASREALSRSFVRRVQPGADPAAAWRRFDAAELPLPSEVPLLVVHDRDDREVAAGEAERLHAAHGERSRLVLTSGSGHTRVLGSDAALDAVVAFTTAGLAGVDAAGLGTRTAAVG